METTRLVLTAEEIAVMDREAFTSLILRAYRIEATCVVRRADGSIKYDDPARAGTYHEEQLHHDDET